MDQKKYQELLKSLDRDDLLKLSRGILPSINKITEKCNVIINDQKRKSKKTNEKDLKIENNFLQPLIEEK